MTTRETATPSAVETLASLDETARNARYQLLQSRMPSVWDAMKHDHDDESVVIIPSVTPSGAASSGTMTQAYEERFLFLLLLLRQPRLRMIYVTSMPIDFVAPPEVAARVYLPLGAALSATSVKLAAVAT